MTLNLCQWRCVDALQPVKVGVDFAQLGQHLSSAIGQSKPWLKIFQSQQGRTEDNGSHPIALKVVIHDSLDLVQHCLLGQCRADFLSRYHELFTIGRLGRAAQSSKATLKKVHGHPG